MAVVIEVAHRDTHASLLAAVLVERHSGFGGNITERAVFIVPEEDAGSGIAGHVYIRPAIAIQVRGHRRESVEALDLADARPLTDVFKGSVAAVAIQRDFAERTAAR